MLKQKIMVVVSVLMGSLLMACSTMTKAEREAKDVVTKLVQNSGKLFQMSMV